MRAGRFSARTSSSRRSAQAAWARCIRRDARLNRTVAIKVLAPALTLRRSGQRWQVSHAGGTEAVWAKNGSRLYFRQGDKLMAVAGSPPFAAATELFEAAWALRGGALRPQYDVAADGESFIMIRPPDPAAARVHVILDWAEELKRRVPC